MSNRDDLEAEKLRLEISDLKKPWIIKNLQMVLTSVVALLGLWFAYSTGLFDVQRATLELQKEQLQRDIRGFTVTQDSLKESNLRVSHENDSLENVADAFRANLTKLQKEVYERSIEVARVQASLKPVAERAKYYEDAVRQATLRYAETSSKYTNELLTKFNTQYNLEKEVERLNGAIKNLEYDTARLKYEVAILTDNPFIPKSKQYDFKKYHFEKVDAYLSGISTKLDEAFRQHILSADSFDRMSDSMIERSRIEWRLSHPSTP